MSVVDTSALAAIVFEEASADRCTATLRARPHLSMSAVSLPEALIVADRRRRGDEMRTLMGSLAIAVHPVTVETAQRAAAAYARWGKGVHPARLNFADCFAYDLAATMGCPLLYVGEDFAQTDVASA